MGILRVAAPAGVLLLIVHGASQHSQSAAARPAAASVTNTQAAKPDVEHGRYLVENVAMCAECHSSRDPKGNIMPERRFQGGPIPFRPPWPNDWAIEAPRNGGLPGYSDEKAIRLLTQGAIDREGRQLRPPMPRFRMTPQDAADVVAYLRTLE
jgi:mono/diheme cytochrome c family protein